MLLLEIVFVFMLEIEMWQLFSSFRHILYGLRENQKKTRTMFALKQYDSFGKFEEKKDISLDDSGLSFPLK